jgi:hypothetical protein
MINGAGSFSSWCRQQGLALGFSRERERWTSGMAAEAGHDDDDTKAHQGSNDRGSEGGLEELLVIVGQIDFRVCCSGTGGEPGPVRGGRLRYLGV